MLSLCLSLSIFLVFFALLSSLFCAIVYSIASTFFIITLIIIIYNVLLCFSYKNEVRILLPSGVKYLFYFKYVQGHV